MKKVSDIDVCGCQWTRTKEYGDVVVKQCAKHARGDRASPKEREEALQTVLGAFYGTNADVRTLK